MIVYSEEEEKFDQPFDFSKMMSEASTALIVDDNFPNVFALQCLLAQFGI